VKILVTGGAGYVGSLLTKRLSEKNHEVLIYDMCWFGKDHINENTNLKLIQADIRDKVSFESAVKNVDVVIHLACISNDPSYDLNENLSKTINYDCFKDLVEISKKNKVKKFIYASSSSVYGYSDDPNVTEEHPLVPLTLYNKFKGLCEPILQDYLDDSFTGVIIRPATVCGYAPHCRLDLSVNILTNHAVNNKKITVLGGGQQKRPNLHVEDMCRAYELLIDEDLRKINGEIFNVSYENKKIIELAEIVKENVQRFFNLDTIDIEVKTDTVDNRSYHVNSDKIKRVLGFEPKFNIDDAVISLCKAFNNGKLKDSLTDPKYINVATLKNSNVL
jgi:nucleoside-diphosphate-sugar epimerase